MNQYELQLSTGLQGFFLTIQIQQKLLLFSNNRNTS